MLNSVDYEVAIKFRTYDDFEPWIVIITDPIDGENFRASGETIEQASNDARLEYNKKYRPHGQWR
jgi:hypothetical protein